MTTKAENPFLALSVLNASWHQRYGPMGEFWPDGRPKFSAPCREHRHTSCRTGDCTCDCHRPERGRG